MSDACFCGATWNLAARECKDGHPMTPAEVAERLRPAEVKPTARLSRWTCPTCQASVAPGAQHPCEAAAWATGGALPVSPLGVPRGVAGAVTWRCMSGDGTGPWRLFLGEYGVADWPCMSADEDPEGYVSEVAKCVRNALADAEHGPLRRASAPAPALSSEQIELLANEPKRRSGRETSNASPCTTCGKPTERVALSREGRFPCCDSSECFEAFAARRRSGSTQPHEDERLQRAYSSLVERCTRQQAELERLRTSAAPAVGALDAIGVLTQDRDAWKAIARAREASLLEVARIVGPADNKGADAARVAKIAEAAADHIRRVSFDYNADVPCSLLDDLASLYVAAPCASVSPDEAAELLRQGAELQDKLAPRIKAMRGLASEPPARLDADGTAAPLTEIVGVFPAGKGNFYHSAETLIARKTGGDSHGARWTSALAAHERQSEMTSEAEVALTAINDVLHIAASVTVKGDEVKCYVACTEEMGVNKTYLSAADCLALAKAFGVVASGLSGSKGELR